MGNESAWKTVHTHVTGNRRHKPLVVWGPTGCGKTWGVRSVLRAAGFPTVVELDGADAENAPQLLEWIKRVRQLKCMSGPAAVLLDDFESFTPHARRAATQLIQSTANDTHLAPLIVTCTQLRDPEMRDLAGLTAAPKPVAIDVRLKAPSEHVCLEWFMHHDVWEDDAGTRRAGHPPAAVPRDLCATGDLRRVARALDWRRRTGARIATESQKPATIFDATRRLLLHRMPAEEWAHMAEERDTDLLRTHLPGHVSDVHTCARGLDWLMEADLCHPERFETRDAACALYVAAAAVRLTSRTRDVGALAPPPRVVSSTGRATAETQGPWRDVPALLGGPSLTPSA